jgi:hypothetical protein
MGEKNNTDSVLVGNPEGKSSRARLMHRLENNNATLGFLKIWGIC